MELKMKEQEILNTQIELKLPLSAVNLILGALAKAPYEQVADLVQAIKEQAIPQVPVPTRSAEEVQIPE